MNKLEELKKRCENLTIPRITLDWKSKEERQRKEETMRMFHEIVNIELKKQLGEEEQNEENLNSD